MMQHPYFSCFPYSFVDNLIPLIVLLCRLREVLFLLSIDCVMNSSFFS